MRFFLAIVASGVASSLTDWFFMGDFVYKRYNRHPEIWRHAGGSKGESRAIAWSAPLPFLTCAVFIFVCIELHLHSYGATLMLAFAVWLIAPLPWIVTTSLFIKLQPMIAASYSLGWLVKLALAAAAVALIRP
ncbi:MAG TPA: hypothetical protein VJO53_06400 [Candidatus Acidoferrales bacterium]|nr:hypothetical protein [Candidatus Acidoferrales bacterium]